MRFRSLNKKMMMIFRVKKDQPSGNISNFWSLKQMGLRPGAKNATCIFCDTEVTGCTAAVHLEPLPIFLVDLFSST